MKYETPDTCEDRVSSLGQSVPLNLLMMGFQGIFGGVAGYWIVKSTDSECTPHWGATVKGECEGGEYHLQLACN